MKEQAKTVTRRPTPAIRLRKQIYSLRVIEKILNEVQFHMAGAADEIDRLNAKIRRLQRKRPCG